MRFKNLMLVAIIASTVSFSAVAQTTDRGFMLFGGLGFAGIEYEDELQDFVSRLEDQGGVDRFKMHLNLGLGFALSDRVYLTGSINGYSDIFTYEDATVQEELQITFVNIAAGLRFYPQVTGWVAGFDFGPATAEASFDANYLTEETSVESDNGGAFGVMVGYDFLQRPTGLSAMVGGRTDFMQIDGEMSAFASLFLSLVFK